jgi:hypothetical protein
MTDDRLPSHMTEAMASRYLGVSKSTVYRHSLRGGDLEPEKILGTQMILTEKVIAFKERLPGKRP